MEPEEKRFWVGITIFATLFGIGGYVVFEHAVWGWIFMVAGVGGLILGIIERIGKIRLANASWVIAIVAGWALLGYDIYDRHRVPDIPEFDDPIVRIPVVQNTTTPTSCGAVIDGDLWMRYQANYRIAAACYLADPSADRMGIPLFIGGARKITSEIMTVTASHRPFDFTGTMDIVLLLIPNNVQIKQFTNLGEARNLGVKIKSVISQTKSYVTMP